MYTTNLSYAISCKNIIFKKIDLMFSLYLIPNGTYFLDMPLIMYKH